MLETATVRDVEPRESNPQAVSRDFLALLDSGHRIVAAGQAKRNPKKLLSMGYTPKHEIRLFDATYYLTNLRHDENLRFFVAFVHLGGSDKRLYPRFFYKDSSLIWRSATHVIRSPGENWIGKGDLKTVVQDGDEIIYAAEETTNLPLEIQTALDTVSRRNKIQRDRRAIPLILRAAPDNRLEPYHDFTGPREKVRRNPRNLINRGKDVAYFTKPGDPTSLRFVAGFEPDFQRGLIDTSRSKSQLYGGTIRKFRFLSMNRKIQYQFIAGPRIVWIIPPQPLTTEIMSYGIRTLDVNVAEDLCVPGYEYHYYDETEDPPRLHSQIPEGYAGPPSPVDPARSDASPWIDKLPVVERFRKQVLRRPRRGRKSSLPSAGFVG